MTRIPTGLLASVGAALGALALLTPPAAAQNREIQLEWLRNVGTRFDGVSTSSPSARCIASAGDVNGDGVDDVLVSSYESTNPFASPGTVYLIYGSLHSPPQDLSLASADVILAGVQSGSETGSSVAGVGDVDGDGFDDILIGAQRLDFTPADWGRAYLVYGDDALPANINLGALAGGAGVVFDGAASGDLAGCSVAGAGDVNGDDIPDLLIGALGANPSGKNNAGRVYIVYGSTSFPDVVSLGSLGATDALILDGSEANDQAGGAVSPAGDVNKDGFDDVIVGAATNATRPGSAYIVYGGASLPASATLNTLGAGGVRLNGENNGDFFGVSVSGGGDVNKDTYDDVIIGAHEHDAPTDSEGRAYVVFGGPGLANVINVSTLGSGGITLTGADPEDEAGFRVAMGGDMNDDGFDDVLVSARRADSGGNAAGEIYLLYGGNSLPNALSLDALGARGIQFNGVDANDVAGESLAFAGDFNGDGFDDAFIGAQDANGGAGEAYVVQGGCNMLHADGTTAEGDVFTLSSHGTPGRLSLLFYGGFKLAAPVDTGVGPFWLDTPFFAWQIKTFDANGQWSVNVPVPVGIGLSGLTLYYQVYEDPSPPWCNISQLLETPIP